MPSSNGNGQHHVEWEHLTPEQVDALAERLSRQLLGVPAARAFEMLDRGDLDGTVAEAELRLLRFLGSARGSMATTA